MINFVAYLNNFIMKQSNYSFICENCRYFVNGECDGLPNGCSDCSALDVYPEYFE